MEHANNTAARSAGASATVARANEPVIVHDVNDAADAVADANAMVWAIFYIVQGSGRTSEADALTACCNQALRRLQDGAEIVEAVAAKERAKEGM